MKLDTTPKPPQSIEAEQSVLGGLLLDNNAWDRIADLVTEADFYRIDHRVILQHIGELIENGKPADVLTVAERLERSGKLAEIGGNSYLGGLAAGTPSAANIRRYAEIVRECSVRRQIQTRCMDLYDRSNAPGVSLADLAQEAESAFVSMPARGGADPVSLGQAVGEAIDARDQPIRAVPTGIPDLDRRLKGGGLRPGQLGIVAGRSGMGKSVLLQQIGQNAGRRGVVVYFTLEMSRQELAERALAYHERELGAVAAYDHLAGLQIQIDETPAASIAHVRRVCRRAKRKLGSIALVVVDYLQLMTGKGENRTQEIGSLSRGLKTIAKEFGVPVLVGAQINRGVEQRHDRRPMLSDLRESGDIEADADVVLMLYREEYYNPDTPARGLCEVIVRKQRNGPVGTVYLHFDAEASHLDAWQGEIPRAPAVRRGGTVATVDFKSKAAGDDR